MRSQTSRLDSIEQPCVSISFSEIISALSFALDLTEGAVSGHALRTCLLGMRIAACAQVSPVDRRSLYYALLLKDVGCSSNAARMCQIIGGDDRAVKARVRLEDWTRPHKPKLSMLHFMWNNVLPDASAVGRAARIGRIGFTQNNREIIGLRCERGSSILLKLGLASPAAEAVRHLDEHWDGSGYPQGLTKQTIPLLARICAVAQHLDVFATDRGPEQAMAVLRDRSGRWFDPELVSIVESLHANGTLWADCLGVSEEENRRRVLELAPDEEDDLGQSQVDGICEAFAEVVDAKSPFTYRHSIRVAEAAEAIALTMGLAEAQLQLVRRASLLHDLGKLSIPNSILDKSGKLTTNEWKVVQGHPGLTNQILSRVAAFEKVASIAGHHHERLDGTGYPDKLRAPDLCLASRIVAVADVYSALSEDRPYHASREPGQIMTEMKKLIPHQLDSACYEALIHGVLKGRWEPAVGGLSFVDKSALLSHGVVSPPARPIAAHAPARSPQ